jgi:cobalt-zinc-cadmium efflux system membrane fusion protein
MLTPQVVMNQASPPAAGDGAEGGERRSFSHRWLWGGVVLVGVVALATVWLSATALQPIETSNRVTDVPIKDGAVIRYSKTFAERAGISTTPASLRKISPRVKAIGTTSFDPQGFAAVGPQVAGRIHRILKTLGAQVSVGDELAEIESAELGQVQARGLAARARERAAWAQLKRNDRSEEAKGTAARDSLHSAYETARTERVAAEQTIKAMGGELQSDKVGVLRLRSPIAGRVIAVRAAHGQAVKPGDNVYDVADLGSVSLVLDVPEKQVANVHVGDPVKVHVPSTKGGLVGKVVHVGDVIDRDARMGAVHAAIDNQSRALRLGQTVTAQIETHAPAANVVSVPLQSITKVDGQTALFVAIDDATVTLREVTTGPEDGTHVAILEGLGEGERVVVGGAFAIKAEVFH